MVELRLIPKEFNGTQALFKEYNQPTLSIFIREDHDNLSSSETLTELEQDLINYLKDGKVADSIKPYIVQLVPVPLK